MSQTKQYVLPKKGIDTLSNETSLIQGTVRKAQNVDLGRDGQFSRRAGFVQRMLGSGFHSLWCAEQRGMMFVARDTQLYQLMFTEGTDLNLKPLATLNSAESLDFVEYNANVYWVNRSTFQWLPSDSDTPLNVGVPTPPSTPTLSAGTGDFRPGRYAVCVSFENTRGEEGGATDVQIIDLPNGGGIVLSDLVQDMRLYYKVYVTDCNGTVLRSCITFPAVFPQYQVSERARGSECDTQFLRPMPYGEHISWLSGRLFVARDNILYFSNAMRPHLYDKAHNYIMFDGRITILEAVTDGMFVGDDRGVWFLKGTDPSKFEMSMASTVQAVSHSSIKLNADNFDPQVVQASGSVALWLSTSGYVVGTDGGGIIELQADRVKIPGGMAGRTVCLFRKGIKQVVTPVNSVATAATGVAVDSSI